jgi:predicted membrane protein
MSITKNRKVGFLYRIQAYFMHGHGAWTGFIVSIGTFLMVLYTFAYSNFLFFRNYFGNPIIYMFIAFPVYFLLAMFIGRWSYYKGPFAERMKLEWAQNPEYVNMRKEMKEIKEDIKELKEMIKNEHFKKDQMESSI